MHRYQFGLARLLLFSFLFHQSRGSFLFQIVSNGLKVLNDRLISCQAGTEAATNVASEDESFNLVPETIDDPIVCEQDYAILFNEILELKQSVITVNKSSSKKFEIIRRICDWRDNPHNKNAILLKEHFDVLIEILKERIRATHIPDSIITEYLTFLTENIIIFNRGTFKYAKILAYTVNLLSCIIRTAGSSDFLKLILYNVYLDLSEDLKLSLYSSYHKMLPEYSKYLDRFPNVQRRQQTYFRICEIYLVLLNYFPRNPFIFSEKIPPIFTTFFHLLPIYKALMSSEKDRFDLSLQYFQLRTFISLHEQLQIFNFFLKQTGFNNNFGASIKRVLHKLQVFAVLKDIFFQAEPLIYILQYCLDYGFLYIFELLLNYSNNDIVFVDTCICLLEKLLIGRDIQISLLAQLLSVCPRITVNVLDEILIILLNENSERRDLNVPIITAFRRIILATENISMDSSNWDMSEKLQNFIAQDANFSPRDPYFFQAARIYLQRCFGIPFSRTKFNEDVGEEVDWIEVIGFVNFFLNREWSLSRDNTLVHKPFVTTNHK
jgi:hypothetical protein